LQRSTYCKEERPRVQFARRGPSFYPIMLSYFSFSQSLLFSWKSSNYAASFSFCSFAPCAIRFW
jgi:hypothetical protein